MHKAAGERHVTASVARSSAFVFLSRLAVPAAAFAVCALIAQRLGPGEFGVYAVVISLYTVFEMIAMAGLDAFISREVARDTGRAGVLLRNGVAAGIISSSVCGLLMVFFAWLLRYPAPVRFLAGLMALALFPAYVNNFCDAVLIAMGRSSAVLRIAVFRETCLLVTVCGGLLLAPGLPGVAAAVIVSRLAGMLSAGRVLSRMGVEAVGKVDRRVIAGFFGVMPVFMMISVCSTLLNEADTLIVSKVAGLENAGYYSLARKFLKFGFSFSLSFVTACVPVIVPLYRVATGRFLFMSGFMVRRAALLAALIALAAVLLAPVAIRLAVGERFLAAVPLLWVMVWSLVPLSVSFACSRLLILADRQSTDLSVVAAAVAALAGIGTVFSALWGTAGMAAAYAVTTGIMAFAHMVCVRKFVTGPETAAVCAGKGETA